LDRSADLTILRRNLKRNVSAVTFIFVEPKTSSKSKERVAKTRNQHHRCKTVLARNSGTYPLQNPNDRKSVIRDHPLILDPAKMRTNSSFIS